MTRRAAMFVVAGVLVGVVAAGVGTASAQATQSGIEQKAKAGAKSMQTKWEALSADQQQKLVAQWKVSAEEAKTKWEALPADQQQELKGKAVAEGQKAKKKFQSLPK